MTVSLNKKYGVGCQDNSCVWGPRGGMGTNGGCRCYGRTSGESQAVMTIRVQLQSGIRLLRELAEHPKVEAALDELITRIKERDQ